jgi:tetratricopeptide (TPR) repeat protein
MLSVQLAEVRLMSAEPTERIELARAKHQQALELMDKQHLPGALRLFGEALAQEETCERWNDWAVAQFTRNQFAEAEQGFRYALELDPANLEVAGNLGVLLVECEREHEAIPFLARAATADNAAAASRSTAEVLATISRDTVATWRKEFENKLRDSPAPLAEIPRWPLAKYALRLAQLGECENALGMVQYNRHFQPADTELIRMEASLQAMVAERSERERSRQGTTAA